jgi:ELWxxDGT repeat protein
MRNLFILFFCISALYTNAQQTISDWQHEKESSSNPRYFIRAGKKIYFLASSKAQSQELWVTEGSPETTHKVKDIGGDRNNASYSLVQQPEIEQSFNLESPPPLSFFNNSAALEDGTLYFVNSENPTDKPKIWITDGTEEGTKIYREEVRGSLFHTGNELVEYLIDGKKGILSILHTDSKKDSNLVIEKGSYNYSGYSYFSAIQFKENLLRICNYQSGSNNYLAYIDLKEQIVKSQVPTVPTISGYPDDFVEWNNNVYMRRYLVKNSKILIGKLNILSGKYDTLSIINSKKDSYISTRFLTTTKECYIYINDSLYTLKNDTLTLKNNPNFKNVLLYRSLLYDEKSDEMYAFENDESKKRMLVKSINMSNGDLIKDYSISNVQYYVRISGTKIWVKEYYTNPKKLSILDIQTQKLTPFPYVLNSIIKQDDKTIFSGYSATPKVNAELYIYDNQTDEVKLLKEINSNGYLKSNIFNTTFNDNLVQVYAHEKGIMLGISDGTKSGTKDVKLLIRNYDNTQLFDVQFQSVNNRLGILISTKNGNLYTKDSIFLFSVNKQFAEIKTLIVDGGRANIYQKPFSRLDSINDFLKLTTCQNIQNGVCKEYITDLTIENTKVLGNDIKYIVNIGKSIIIQNNPQEYYGNSLLIKYNLSTFTSTTIPNSQKCRNIMTFERKIYFYNPQNDTYYVTD